MRRKLAVLGLVGALLCGAATLATVPSVSTQAASSSATFIIPADDSYGVAECTSNACGKVVADQWCVAQGFVSAVAFGPADPVEVTGSVQTRGRASQLENKPVSITCSR